MTVEIGDSHLISQPITSGKVYHDSTLRGDGTKASKLRAGTIPIYGIADLGILGNGTVNDPLRLTSEYLIYLQDDTLFLDSSGNPILDSTFNGTPSFVPIELTEAAALDLITGATLIPNQWYKVTNLIDERCEYILARAATTSTFDFKALGAFPIPDYTSDGSYDFAAVPIGQWDPRTLLTSIELDNVTGGYYGPDDVLVGDVNAVEVTVVYYNAAANLIYVTNVSNVADLQSSTTLTGNSITADIVTVTAPVTDMDTNSVVVYNGFNYRYERASSNLATDLNPSVGNDYTRLAYTTSVPSGYTLQLDHIHWIPDIAIYYREDKRGNVYDYANQDDMYMYLFRWGHPTTKGNKMISGSFNCVNAIGEINDNKIVTGGYVSLTNAYDIIYSANTASEGGGITLTGLDGVSVSGNSFINGVVNGTLITGGNIGNNSLLASSLTLQALGEANINSNNITSGSVVTLSAGLAECTVTNNTIIGQTYVSVDSFETSTGISQCLFGGGSTISGDLTAGGSNVVTNQYVFDDTLTLT